MNATAAMSCPVCRVPLTMSERQGVEIDYCPQCRGIWLDRGELDKILERAAREMPAAAVAPTAPVAPAYGTSQPGYPANPTYAPPAQDSHGQQSYDPRYGNQGYDQGHRRKKKEHWLSDLFD